MSLSTAESAIRDTIEHVATDFSRKAKEVWPHLEELGRIAAQVEASPLAQLVLASALSPEVEQKLTELLQLFVTVTTPDPAPTAPQPVLTTDPVAPVPGS